MSSDRGGSRRPHFRPMPVRRPRVRRPPVLRARLARWLVGWDKPRPHHTHEYTPRREKP